jgi:hypothetical protein
MSKTVIELGPWPLSLLPLVANHVINRHVNDRSNNGIMQTTTSRPLPAMPKKGEESKHTPMQMQTASYAE